MSNNHLYGGTIKQMQHRLYDRMHIGSQLHVYEFGEQYRHYRPWQDSMLKVKRFTYVFIGMTHA